MAEEEKPKRKTDWKFRSKTYWGALDGRPKVIPILLNHPIENVRITDTETATCFSHEECDPIIQELQLRDMDKRKLRDLNYNFLVGGDGTVYEGRGWHTDVDARPNHETLKGNCMDIAYIGNHKDPSQVEKGFPTAAAEKALKDWIEWGQGDVYYIKTPYELILDTILTAKTPQETGAPVENSEVSNDSTNNT